MTVAVFDYTAWAARYPTLAATVNQTLAAEYFDEAQTYCENKDCSLVPCDPATYQPRLRLLGMLVAHLAALDDPSRIGSVGRVSDASQGSVSVKLEMAPAERGADWFMQTQYGAAFWKASAMYRMGALL